MGRRSQQRRTGLTSEQRIQRSIKRKQKEEETRRKEEMKLAETLIESCASPALPIPPALVNPNSPVMRELLKIEQMREQEKREKKT